MPIDPATLAASIATLTDLDPEQDLTSTLEQTVQAAKQLFQVDAAGIMLGDADGRLRWGQRLGPPRRAADPLSPQRPGPAGRGADRHLGCLRRRPRRLGRDRGQRPADLCRAGRDPARDGCQGPAERPGGRTTPSRVGSSEHARAGQGCAEEAGRLDDQQAFIDLRRAARSSSCEPPDGGKVINLLRPHGEAEPAGTADGRALELDMGALDGDVVAVLERAPGADGMGRKLSQLLLGFLATEVVPLAERLAELGIDPTPLFATASGILRLYADTLERPDHQ